jgi:PAS domain S-box-containing protein
MQQSPAPVITSPALHSTRRTRPQSRAWRITGIYAVIATLWIVFSDQVLAFFVNDPALLVRWSVYKGIGFVAFTSLLLLILMQRAYGAIEDGYASLKAHKREIERGNRLYEALSHINQSIVAADDRDELFQQVTRALVNHGGFSMAWIGWHPPGQSALIPLAAFGNGTAYIDHIITQTNNESQRYGIWEHVISDGVPYVCNDVLFDRASQGWRREAIKQNLQSFAVLPLRTAGKALGVLSVYADEPDFFRRKEMKLLEEAALDVSFALDNFVLAQERQEAEAIARGESLFSQAMIESMPGIVYFYDKQGRFLRWNRNFEIVSGYSGEQVAQMHPLQFFDKEDQPLLEESIGRVFSHGEASVEAPFRSRDGNKRPYFFTGRSVIYDGQECLVGVGIDISDRRKAEDALRELNEKLEHMVAERTTELQAAVIRAEAADRIKSAFLATMSHELRTPLNSIIGFTGIVLQELAGPLTGEQKKQLGMVKGSARHLLELINDVLDLSKIEAGQLEVSCEPFDIRASVTHVIESMKPMAERKAIALNCILEADVPDTMRGDRRRTEQILLNLLNNAVKFTDTGSVTLEIATTEDAMLSISVADTGIGIKPEDLASLFQPFQQVDSGLTRHHDGTGLGLTICRRLTDLMGGSITATSEWKVGSRFTALLPLNPMGAS